MNETHVQMKAGKKREHAVVRQLAREIRLKGKLRFVPAGRCPDTGNWIQAWWQHWQIIPKHGRQRSHRARFHIFQRTKAEICCWQIDQLFTTVQEFDAALQAKALNYYESMPLDLVTIGRPRKFVGCKVIT